MDGPLRNNRFPQDRHAPHDGSLTVKYEPEGDGSTPDPGGDFDPESAASVGDLAALLRRLHLEAGKPSLRELSRHDRGLAQTDTLTSG